MSLSCLVGHCSLHNFCVLFGCVYFCSVGILFLLFVRGRLFYRPNWLSSLLLHMIFVVFFLMYCPHGNKVDIWLIYDI